ncbi:MAG: class I SAM-dependent methyltransferase [Candidatus Ozemobacteraceae bacterium]
METDWPLPQIDWEACYQYPWHRNNAGEDDKNQARFWDEKSLLFSQKAHNPDHRRDVETLLNRFTWDPCERVIDVGAGPGTFAIPLAQRVQHVTAIDASFGMLTELHKQASRENVSNIFTTPGRWLSFSPEALPKHDTVVCFNAPGVIANRLSIADDPERLTLLETHLHSRLVKSGDSFVLTYPVSQALFSWEK